MSARSAGSGAEKNWAQRRSTFSVKELANGPDEGPDPESLTGLQNSVISMEELLMALVAHSLQPSLIWPFSKDLGALLQHGG